MEREQASATSAKLAGHEGRIVGVSGHLIQWEVDLAPQQLSSFIARCGGGGPLSITTSQGMLSVRARRWWVWPRDDTVRIRLALEDGSS